MSVVKKLRIQQEDGQFSDYVDLGAKSINIDMEDGTTLQDKMDKVIDEHYTKEETYTREEIEKLIHNLLDIQVVDSLPEEADTSVIYWIAKNKEDISKGYDQGIFSGGKWVDAGDTVTDLSNYYTKPESVRTFYGTTPPVDSLGKDGDIYVLIDE